MSINYKRLGDIATYINGYAFKPKDWGTKGLPIIRIQNLTGSSKEINFYDGDIDEKYIVRKGDILIAWSASLGVHEWNGEKALLNQHIFKVVFDKEKINKNFFKFMVQKVLERTQKYLHGSTMKHITKKYFDNLLIPFPPLEIQEKIAGTLLLAESLVNKRKAQIEALDQLTQSVFLEMFGDPLGNPKGWQKITFKDYISKVNKINLKNSKNNIKYIDISSIDNNKNKITSYTEYIGIEAPSRAQQVVQKGDILISTVRPNLKNIAMVMDNYDNLICSTGFCVIRCTEKLNNDFIFHLIKTDSFTKNLVKKTTGANYPAVKNSDIYNESIIYPPIDLQEKFSNITKQIEEKKRFLENSLSYQEKLFNSILQKAFNGELFTEEKASNF